ncbi:hypothetical protein BTHE68_39930 [Burkholderia sp. THE68]|uniref:DUF6471 domain-containing protein n=1 Tax=Burkholderia sp. THE68 TaxID=758782 RepID=UPI0013171CE8|nr:DUF6471 domain-containing protein [Burkholderia sp. THE68]BBU30259.1 hypothetical protein BTHE68_39930 [Burkholderia sp. THE68]
MNEASAVGWSKLASRVMRAVLARKDLNYSDLASLMKATGAIETARSVEGKIQRGAMRCSFFLHTLDVIGAECPPQWRDPLQDTGSWEMRAALLLQAEISNRPGVTYGELARRLQTIGVDVSLRALEEQITDGTYPLTLLLQCSAVLWIAEIERFVDRVDLRAASNSAKE